MVVNSNPVGIWQITVSLTRRVFLLTRRSGLFVSQTQILATDIIGSLCLFGEGRFEEILSELDAVWRTSELNLCTYVYVCLYKMRPLRGDPMYIGCNLANF
jgi:hypothetical protein